MNTKDRFTFHPERPCETPVEHNGREALLQHAFGRLGADDTQSFVLIGAEKMGKSSFLRHLCHPEVYKDYLEQPDTYTFVYLDAETEELSGVQAGENLFFQVLFRHLQALSDDNHTQWEDSSDLRDVAVWLKQQNKRLILLIDNFNLIITHPNYRVAFYESLRSWFSTHHQIGCVLSSPVQLLQLAMPLELSGSPFFNIFAAYLLEPLTLEESKDLLNQRLPTHLQAQTEQIELLIKHFCRTPYLLQQAGFAWCEHSRHGHVPDLEPVIEQAYQACQPYYESLYSDLGQHLAFIEAFVDPQQANPEAENVDRILVEYGVVDETGESLCALQTIRFFQEKFGIRPTNRLGCWWQAWRTFVHKLFSY